MFDFRPKGGLAEYALVKKAHTSLVPDSLSLVEAAALPSSALAAMRCAEAHMRKGDRVLVLGASGGVGVHLVQFLRIFGASHIAGTSTAAGLLASSAWIE